MHIKALTAPFFDKALTIPWEIQQLKIQTDTQTTDIIPPFIFFPFG